MNEYFKRKFTSFQGTPKTKSGKIKHKTDEYKKVAYRQLGPQESKLTLKVTNNLLFLTVSKPMRINWEAWKKTLKKWVYLELIYPQHALFGCRINPRHLGSSFFRIPLKLSVVCYVFYFKAISICFDVAKLIFGCVWKCCQITFIYQLNCSVIICFTIRNLWYRKTALTFSTIFVI